MDSATPEATQDSSGSSDSSDDIPLVRLKENLTAEKKREVHTSMDTNNKKTGLDTSESSDNEPLIEVAKRAVGADKKTEGDLPKKSVKMMGTDSSDDEPLSVLATKLKPTFRRESPVETPREAAKVTETKRSRKRVKYAETSSDGSDNEPLATVKQKLIKTARVQKTTQKQKKTNGKDSLPRDYSSDDDDLPLVNLLARKNSLKEHTKTKAELRVSASVKSQGNSHPSSEDEPLINLVKKGRTKTKRQTHVTGSERNDCSSDDDDMPLTKLVDKKKSAKESTKRKTEPQVSASVKSQGNSHPSSEDEPLINLVKKGRTKTKTKTLVTGRDKNDCSSDDDMPLANLVNKIKSAKESTKRKTHLQVSASTNRKETSEASSEDEPLMNLVKKRQAHPKVKTPKKKTKNPKTLEKHASDSSSDDDDVPLVNLMSKIKSGKENAKRKVESQVSASRKRQVSSSEDEPLINLAKRRPARSTVKAPKKNKTPTVLREQQVQQVTGQTISR